MQVFCMFLCKRRLPGGRKSLWDPQKTLYIPCFKTPLNRGVSKMALWWCSQKLSKTPDSSFRVSDRVRWGCARKHCLVLSIPKLVFQFGCFGSNKAHTVFPMVFYLGSPIKVFFSWFSTEWETGFCSCFTNELKMIRNTKSCPKCCLRGVRKNIPFGRSDAGVALAGTPCPLNMAATEST
jgi:hypothetical protein